MSKTKSIVTEYDGICFFCGKPAECEHHLLFGNGIRELAEQDGLKVPMCNKCHNMGLEKLKTVLAAGVPPETALEAVDSCVDADTIIKYYRGGTA